jgi:hypothetical protein
LLSHGGAVVWLLIACGVLGDPLGMFLYANGIAGYGMLMDLQRTGSFAMGFGSVLTIGFLTFHWVAINLAIDRTTLQLRLAGTRTPRDARAAATAAAATALRIE